MKRLLPLVILLAGCSFFSKSRSTVYSVERVAGPVVAVSGAPFGIDNVEIPPGFDRREIVVRQAGAKLDIRANELWPATLGTLVTHTLASDLADRLPAGMVILPGAARPANVRAIDVAVEEIAAGPEPNVTLDARWTVAGAAHHETISVPVPSLESASVATGMSTAIGQLADRIAAGL